MKKLALIALSFAFATFGVAQGTIEGKILNENGEPQPFVSVAIKSGGNLVSGGITDMNGRYRISGLQSGSYNIEASYTGYKTQLVAGVPVIKDKNERLKDITLSPQAYLIDGDVEIVADLYDGNERLIKPDNTGEITLLPTELLKNPNLKNPKTLIAGSMPGVYQADENQPLYIKGSRPQSVQYFIDGVKSTNGELGIPSNAIGEITVYTGGVPAKYGDLSGGAVVIETKNYFSLYNQRKRTEEIEKMMKEMEENGKE